MEIMIILAAFLTVFTLMATVKEIRDRKESKDNVRRNDLGH